jgi:V/A-type H+-transporting ATPase subunit K
MKRSIKAIVLSGILLFTLTFAIQAQALDPVDGQAEPTAAAAAPAAQEQNTAALIAAYIGFGLMVGLSCTGSATGGCITGCATIGAMKKREEAFGSYMLLTAVCTTQGLYGFAGFFVLNSAIASQPGGWAALTSAQGAAILGAGILMGVACLYSAIKQATMCAEGVAAIASGHDVFGKTMILAAFPELFAIISFATTFLISTILV